MELQVSHDSRSTNHELKDKVEEKANVDGANVSQSTNALKLSKRDLEQNTRDFHSSSSVQLAENDLMYLVGQELANYCWRRTNIPYFIRPSNSRSILYIPWEGRGIHPPLPLFLAMYPQPTSAPVPNRNRNITSRDLFPSIKNS